MIKITTLKEWERYAFGSRHIISVCYVWYNSAADFCLQMFLGKIFESSFFHCPCHPSLANKTSKPGPEKVHLAIRFFNEKVYKSSNDFPVAKWNRLSWGLRGIEMVYMRNSELFILWLTVIQKDYRPWIGSQVSGCEVDGHPKPLNL